MSSTFSRRQVVAAGAAVPALGLVTACGSETGGTEVAAPEVEAGELIGAASDVPVGSCKVFSDPKVVVTQPTAGEFKAFSAVCTHQGCLVSSAPDGNIPCRCHMSFFSPTDGSVVDGPAKGPLTAVDITVADGEIRVV
ncbi:Rieske (2Fe-2S) protein [Nocardioides yefusunii]|uniref:Cytochrome bc1 complex Rieske iron-sulfur subunit n=1 Tax=Nocardioides yefusunii TaxID=2500546 RepID=A0ABW1R128_9ACTN|nr:Rieske (2Fe-2S) protein [Nocardioides yefusunii]